MSYESATMTSLVNRVTMFANATRTIRLYVTPGLDSVTANLLVAIGFEPSSNYIIQRVTPENCVTDSVRHQHMASLALKYAIVRTEPSVIT